MNQLHIPPEVLARTSETDRASLPKQTCAMPDVGTLRDDVLQALTEFAMDCAGMYRDAVPAEVVRRADLLVRLSEKGRKQPGYGTPPPVRCEHCDNS